MIDLCFLHAEIGNRAYRSLAERFVASALQVGGLRPVQFADLASVAIVGSERVIRTPITSRNLMLARTQMFKEYLPRANNNVICCDCDIVWHNSPTPLFSDDFDLGVLHRANHPSTPYGGGFILARHSSEVAVDFLTEWWSSVLAMPTHLRGWHGDEMALAKLLGRREPDSTCNVIGCRVKVFDYSRILFDVRRNDQIPPRDTYASHCRRARRGPR